MIDGLSCENCPQYHKKRCKEQQEKKNNIIKNILNDIVDKAKICGCDIKKETEILFQQITNVTRCDVVLEKQLKKKERECKELKSKLQKAENNCIKVFNLFSELGEKYTKLKGELEKLTEALMLIKKCAVTEMVEIATRADYNGFLALQGITAKVNQVLKITEVENER